MIRDYGIGRLLLFCGLITDTDVKRPWPNNWMVLCGDLESFDLTNFLSQDVYTCYGDITSL